LENTGILIYCIIQEFDEKLSEIRGLDESNRLYAIKSGPLTAIVSDVNLEEYGEDKMAENGENIEWLKEKATMFMEVILKVMDMTSVIPMKFLTIFLSEHRVMEILRENHEDFQETFRRISGHDEFGVKIYCDERKYRESVLSEEIRDFDNSLAGKPKGAAFFLRKKFETELDEKIRNRIYGISSQFAEKLSALTSDMKINKNLVKEITGIEIPMILNCAYLVKHDQKEAFAGRIEEFLRNFGSGGFYADLTGPWPPYSFC
jgi:hypothetical protein